MRMDHFTCRRVGWALAAVGALLAADSARGGAVCATNGRVVGDVNLRPGCVTVGDKKVPWADVVTVLMNEKVRPLPGPNVLRMTNGERWAGRALGLAAGKITVKVDPLGKHLIDVKHISAVEFEAGLPAGGKLRARYLYREGQQPMPAAMLWFDERRIAVDGPFGAITLSRDGTQRYVFSLPAGRKDADDDEVTLVNGTLLRGRLSGADVGVKLRHALLGEVSIPTAAIRSVIRAGASAELLTDLVPQSAKTVDPVGGERAAAGVEVLTAESAAAEGLGFVRALRIEPKTVLKYALGPPLADHAVLRTRLALARGYRGDVTVRIAAGGRTLLEQELAAGAEPAPIELVLPPSGTLTIEVDFGKRLGMPCSALLADPILTIISRPKKSASTKPSNLPAD